MCDNCKKDQKIMSQTAQIEGLTKMLSQTQQQRDHFAGENAKLSSECAALLAKVERLDKTLQGAVMWGESIIEILAELRDTAVQAVIGAPVDENVINLLAAAGRADDMLDTMAEIIESEQEAI